MKLSNKTIVEFMKSDIVSKKLPVKFAFALSLNIAAISPAFKAYDEQRMLLLKSFAKKGDDNKPIVNDGSYVVDDVEGWNKSITELLEAEADINITTVDIGTLEKCDKDEFDTLSVQELVTISFMIERG